MHRYELLNGTAHSVIQGCSVRINQEVLRVHRNQLDGDTVFLGNTDSRLSLYAGDSLSSRSVLLLCLNSDLTDTCTVDLSHQFNLVNSLLNLVTVEVFHQLSFELLNVQGSAVNVLQIILNIEPLALPEQGLHNFSVSSLNRLLCGRGDDTATF